MYGYILQSLYYSLNYASLLSSHSNPSKRKKPHKLPLHASILNSSAEQTIFIALKSQGTCCQEEFLEEQQSGSKLRPEPQ